MSQCLDQQCRRISPRTRRFVSTTAPIGSLAPPTHHPANCFHLSRHVAEQLVRIVIGIEFAHLIDDGPGRLAQLDEPGVVFGVINTATG